MDLTREERELARMVADGKSNRAIAAVLGVSLRTVESRLQAILAKLGVESRAALATLALNDGKPSLAISTRLKEPAKARSQD